MSQGKMTTEVTVKNPNTLSARLWSMKNKEEFCDATVVVNEKIFPVHKIVLASASGYFKKFFEKSPQNVVTFRNVDFNDVEILLKYCYTGKIKITLDNANEVLTLARILSMNFILNRALKIFEKTYSFETCFSSWNINQMGVLEKLYGKQLCISEKALVAVDSKTDTSETKHVLKTVPTKPTFIHTIAAVGGADLDQAKTIEILNLDNGQWEEIEVNLGKDSYASVFLRDKLFLIGGYENYEAVNSVNCYDLKSGTMIVCSPMKYPRRWLAAVQYDGFIFAMGGSENMDSVTYVEKFDSTTNKWTEVDPMDEARYRFASAVLDLNIYVVGGKANGDSRKNLSSTEAYSIAKNRWRSCASMNHARFAPGLAAVRGYLYAVGGFNDKHFLTSVEMYDSTIDKWTLLAQSIHPGRNGLAASDYMGQLIIAGGLYSDSLKTVETFNPSNKEWKSIQPLKQAREVFCLVQIPWNLARDLLLKNRASMRN